MKTKEQKYQAIELDGLKVISVTAVNHKPHPYTIGSKHVAYAADHYGGLLGEDVCRKVKCAVRGCKLPYDQHTYDTVMFMELTKNLTQGEARKQLQILVDAGMEDDKIDGFAFVKGEFEFI